MTFQVSQLLAPLALSGLIVAGGNVAPSTAQLTPAMAPNAIEQAKLIAEQQEVEAAGQTWANALASRNPNTIAGLYANQAVLLATFSSKLNTPTQIQTYFVGLTQREGLKVNYNDQSIRILDENSAINSGLYTFSYQENGKIVTVPARYTFVYEKIGDRWMIVEHHSSLRPKQD